MRRTSSQRHRTFVNSVYNGCRHPHFPRLLDRPSRGRRTGIGISAWVTSGADVFTDIVRYLATELQ